MSTSHPPDVPTITSPGAPRVGVAGKTIFTKEIIGRAEWRSPSPVSSWVHRSIRMRGKQTAAQILCSDLSVYSFPTGAGTSQFQDDYNLARRVYLRILQGPCCPRCVGGRFHRRACCDFIRTVSDDTWHYLVSFGTLQSMGCPGGVFHLY
jgi:hypothetical protein